jgi:N-acetylmuramoyl-L-alanine amidase
MTPYEPDGQDDVGKILYTLEETCTWSYTIRNPFSTKLRGASMAAMSAGRHSTSWDGTQKIGNSYEAVPNGRYPISMLFTDVAGNRRWVGGTFVVHSYYLVCIDPGHGGKNGVYDPGAVGPTGLRESVVNFDVGYNRLRPILEAVATSEVGYPIRVVMTRNQERDPTMTLAKRPAIANSRGANIFVSIHCNAAIISSAHGTETYYYNDGTSRGDRSRILASYIHNRVIQKTGRYNRGVKSADFYVLRHTRMPSVLHEIAFISNPTEERLLKTGTFRARVATGIRDGIVAFLKAYP